MLKRAFTGLFILLTFFACSSMQSGQYIRINRGDTWSGLAKKHNIKMWKLKAANNNKRLLAGDVIFIPLKRGILGRQPTQYKVEEFFESGEFDWPVPSSKRISSHFGARWGRAHEGVDIPARVGANIVAIADAVVVYSGAGLGGYGNLTVLAHKNGFFSVYAHAKKNFTKKGQKVYRGQVIGQVGMTGRTSGPHLHFEMRHDSRAVDPLKFYAFIKR